MIEMKHNMVLLSMHKTDNVSSGGIILQHHTAKETTEQGVIEKVGPGKLDKNGNRIPMDDSIVIGHTATILSNMGMEFDGMRIVSEDDIMYVVE